MIVYPVTGPLGAVHVIDAEVELMGVAVTDVGASGAAGRRVIELEGDENGPGPARLLAETVNV